MAGVGLPDSEWLARTHEDALDPQQRICDAHHHYWDRPVPGSGNFRYLFDEFAADLATGHNVCASVTVEAGAFLRPGLTPGTMYRADGPKELESLGETEFLNGMAAMARSRAYSPANISAGLVAFANLSLGDAVGEILDMHCAYRRVRGIRNLTFYHEDAALGFPDLEIEPGVLGSDAFRAGFRCLADRDLTYDATALPTQIPEVTALARAFPTVRIVLNHIGGIFGAGPYDGRRQESFDLWRSAMQELATCPNVFVKIGGMSNARSGFNLRNRPAPARSQELAALWKPYVETCIELFGADRCMFESNFPVEKQSVSYTVLWNSFKLLTNGCSADEKDRLFFQSAVDFYRLELV
ncbi:amidohydrolase family protein [Aureimonas fodinaquatilis]|uniref:Amidohydrolase family protein n=1 Tax=Aureimonas fodinaquatilis TaxID=2565783 RepID=A0A5B0DX57_9HYPH|nr:amidohydrolase family protein [Aureimonas fodinaquatilis]KAA0970150.1 amidohydrolase family protein [Aureimonas fodinaquatilis]